MYCFLKLLHLYHWVPKISSQILTIHQILQRRNVQLTFMLRYLKHSHINFLIYTLSNICWVTIVSQCSPPEFGIRRHTTHIENFLVMVYRISSSVCYRRQNSVCLYSVHTSMLLNNPIIQENIRKQMFLVMPLESPNSSFK